MNPNRQTLIFENLYPLNNYLIKTFINITQKAIDENGRATIALSGGRTPIEFYCRLSSLKDAPIWSKTHLFLTDERFVPLNDKDSNFRLVKENLLNYIDIPLSQIHAVPTHTSDAATAARQYEQTLREVFSLKESSWPSFDFMLLGLGEDGHTASLFPGTSAIDETQRFAVDVLSHKKPTARVTLTLPVINQAKNIFLLATGKSKSGVVKGLIDQDPFLVASKVSPVSGNLTYLLDKEAAAKIPYLKSYTHYQQAIKICS